MPWKINYSVRFELLDTGIRKIPKYDGLNHLNFEAGEYKNFSSAKKALINVLETEVWQIKSYIKELKKSKLADWSEE